jgi:hypothetical protein
MSVAQYLYFDIFTPITVNALFHIQSRENPLKMQVKGLHMICSTEETLSLAT